MTTKIITLAAEDKEEDNTNNYNENEEDNYIIVRDWR